MTLVAQRIADGRVLRLIESMLKAGCMTEGQWLPTDRGTPQGGVISPLLSNILLTPFDREMRRRGYQLTRYADDWVVTCQSGAEAKAAFQGLVSMITYLGGYGNTVILDHGQGLFTVYGHLSKVAVNLDQKVRKGDVIGYTGQTGLAGGDHLHFSTMVSEMFVNPIEWWDTHWIRDNITKKLALLK